MKMTNFLVQYYIPFSIADDLRPLFLNIFPDSQIAKAYARGRTKATCILNNAIAPHFTGMYSATSPLELLHEYKAERSFTRHSMIWNIVK